MMQNKNMVRSATTLLLVFMLINSSLYELAQAAAGAATASGGAAGAAGAAGATGSAGTGAAAATTSQAATTTTTTSTSASDSSSASASGGAAAATTSQANNNGPFSAVQTMVGGALNIASMPLNTISASLSQMGLPNMATAPFGAITNLFHQAGSVYGK